MEKHSKTISLVIALAFVVGTAIAGSATIGLPPMLIISSAGTLALAGWLFTTFKTPAEPATIVPIFILTVAGLIVHLGEEYAAGFGPAMSRLFGIEFTERRFLIVFAFVGPLVYQIVTLGLLRRSRLANFFAWFIFIGPGFLEFMHFVFPLIEGGPYHYFPGMYTAVLPMIPGYYGMYRLIRTARNG